MNTKSNWSVLIFFVFFTHLWSGRSRGFIYCCAVLVVSIVCILLLSLYVFFCILRARSLSFPLSLRLFARSTATAMLVFNWGAKVVVAIRRMPFIDGLEKRFFMLAFVSMANKIWHESPFCVYASIYFQDHTFFSEIIDSQILSQSFSMSIRFVFN